MAHDTGFAIRTLSNTTADSCRRRTCDTNRHISVALLALTYENALFPAPSRIHSFLTPAHATQRLVPHRGIRARDQAVR